MCDSDGIERIAPSREAEAAERMAVIHEMNGVLCALRMWSELLRSSSEKDELHRKAHEAIAHCIEHQARLIRRLSDAMPQVQEEGRGGEPALVPLRPRRVVLVDDD